MPETITGPMSMSPKEGPDDKQHVGGEICQFALDLLGNEADFISNTLGTSISNYERDEVIRTLECLNPSEASSALLGELDWDALLADVSGADVLNTELEADALLHDPVPSGSESHASGNVNTVPMDTNPWSMNTLVSPSLQASPFQSNNHLGFTDSSLNASFFGNGSSYTDSLRDDWNHFNFPMTSNMNGHISDELSSMLASTHMQGINMNHNNNGLGVPQMSHITSMNSNISPSIPFNASHGLLGLGSPAMMSSASPVQNHLLQPAFQFSSPDVLQRESMQLAADGIIINSDNIDVNESLDPDEDTSVSVQINNAELWSHFYAVTNEMITSAKGRHLFPALQVSVTGLDEDENYMVWLHFQCEDDPDVIWKFSESNGWQQQQKHVSKKVRALEKEKKALSPSRHIYNLPASPCTGKYLMETGMHFGKVRVTNRSENTEAVFLESFHMYTPVVYIAPIQGDPSSAVFAQPKDVLRFPLKLCQFIASTAYHNEDLVKLKIVTNPMARASEMYAAKESAEHKVLQQTLSETFATSNATRINHSAATGGIDPISSTMTSTLQPQAPIQRMKRPMPRSASINDLKASPQTPHLVENTGVHLNPHKTGMARTMSMSCEFPTTNFGTEDMSSSMDSLGLLGSSQRQQAFLPPPVLSHKSTDSLLTAFSNRTERGGLSLTINPSIIIGSPNHDQLVSPHDLSGTAWKRPTTKSTRGINMVSSPGRTPFSNSTSPVGSPNLSPRLSRRFHPVPSRAPGTSPSYAIGNMRVTCLRRQRSSEYVQMVMPPGSSCNNDST